MTAVAHYALAVVALWLALRGIWRLWRARLRLTPAPVVYAVAAGGALGLSLWLAATPGPEAADTVGDVLRWLVEHSGLAAAWDAIVEWATQRLADAVDALLETFGLR